MNAKKILKASILLLAFVAVSAFLVYAFAELRKENPKERCETVEIEFENAAGQPFLNEQNIMDLLRQANLYPKGRLMSDVDASKIEEALKDSRFVRDVTCYKVGNNPDGDKGRIRIVVSLRTPVIYVLPDGEDGYYVDAEGVVIPNSSYSRNLLTATGQISPSFASRSLSAFGEYVGRDSLWNNLIEQVYVVRDSRGRYKVTLVPRIGNHTVYLGTLDKYETKLRRLAIFYREAIPKVGWAKYKQLNLEYDNQVVCTR